MAVSFIRVDDRMIHGQTCTRWALEYPCDGLIAVNNAAAKNPVLKAAYKSASGKKTFVWSVDEFKEKPDLKTARHYVDAGNYFWNAGIFVWNVKTIEEAIRRYAPGIAEVFDRIYPEFYTEREKETIKELFPTCESISIDYAVMEKAERIYVLPAEFGWSDLGSWGSLHSLLPKDNRNNAIVGENIRLYECNNCIVHTPHLKQAVIQGLDGYIIAEKEGTLLICKLAEEQRIKEFSKA